MLQISILATWWERCPQHGHQELIYTVIALSVSLEVVAETSAAEAGLPASAPSSHSSPPSDTSWWKRPPGRRLGPAQGFPGGA